MEASGWLGSCDMKRKNCDYVAKVYQSDGSTGSSKLENQCGRTSEKNQIQLFFGKIWTTGQFK